MLAAEFAVQIGPELLHNVAGGIDSQLDCQLGSGIGCSAVIRIICFGNRYRGGVAEHFGKVELRSSAVGVGPEGWRTA